MAEASPSPNKLRFTVTESILDRGISILSSTSFSATDNLAELNQTFSQAHNLQQAMQQKLAREQIQRRAQRNQQQPRSSPFSQQDNSFSLLTRMKQVKAQIAKQRRRDEAVQPKKIVNLVNSPAKRPPSSPKPKPYSSPLPKPSPMKELQNTHRVTNIPTLKSTTPSKKSGKEAERGAERAATPKKVTTPKKKVATPTKKVATPTKKVVSQKKVAAPPPPIPIPPPPPLPAAAVPLPSSAVAEATAAAAADAGPQTAEQKLLEFLDPKNNLCRINSPGNPKRKRSATPGALDASLARALQKKAAQRQALTKRTPSTPRQSHGTPDSGDVKSPTADCMTPYERKLKSLLQNKNTQVLMLTNQLKAHGDVAIEEVVSLPEAKKRMMAAMMKLMEGDEKAEEDFNKWDRFVNNHPESIAEKLKEEAEWVERNQKPNEDALEVMKTFVPPDCFSTNLSRLKGELPEKVAERIFVRKILWLVRAEVDVIKKIHIAELKTKFQANKLDLVEMRAVVSVIPTEFENDADGKKKEWRDKLVERLREMVKKEEGGDLKVGERDRAYGGMERGPYDPNAQVVVVKRHTSTPYEKGNIDDIRSLCKEGGKFSENRKVISVQKTVVKPNKDRIDVGTIGSVKEGNEKFLKKLEKCLGGTSDGEEEDEAAAVGRGSPLKEKEDIKNKLEMLFGGGKPPVVKMGVKKEKVETGAVGGDKEGIKNKLEALFGGGVGGGGGGGGGSKKKAEVVEVPRVVAEGGGMEEKRNKLSALFGNNTRPPMQPRSMNSVAVATAPAPAKKMSFLEEMKAIKQKKSAVASEQKEPEKPKMSFMEEIRMRAEKRSGGEVDKENFVT
jgi:hypothetical protein